MKNPHLLLLAIMLLIIPYAQGQTEELPIPSYQNSVIVSIELPYLETAEVDYIKSSFNFGLYSWLSFSWTSAKPVLDWHTAWDQADAGIQSFKVSVNNFIQKAEVKNVKCHLVLGAGLNRGVFIYRDAKEEDIRSCQWYNDNKIASDTQILDPDAMDNAIWSTLSRYARKKRSNLEAKARAALAFLKQRMNEEPDVLYLLSGWAETELNFNRIIQSQSVQDYFCDYSPFAVLEFRDWIAHTGMYDDSTGDYAGQGYSLGGVKYQGASGLAQFNTDFGTGFTTWDLEYYHWSLSDDYDTDPTDTVNNDPHRIPVASYSHGNMMPTSGPQYIAGGFDPPRIMQPGNAFWDLWNLFRETMVHHCVKDLAIWASEAGIPAERWFSHQIPADYLFGTKPSDVNKNARYYTSASPMWTADIQPYGSVGATLYDVKFPPALYPPEYARSTLYGLPDIQAMASNWAIMEYDAETYPVGLGVTQSTPEIIFDQYMNVYDHNAHVINFWMWWDDTQEHRIKGMNKETALRNFVEAIRDKGRNTTAGFEFDPPQVNNVSGSYDGGSGALVIDIDKNIWDGHTWEWQDWGDFAHFEIHRSTQAGFTPDAATLVDASSDYLYEDTTYVPAMVNYYRVRAVNSDGIGGPYSDELMLIPSSTDVPVLYVDKHSLLFGAEQGNTATSAESVTVMNLGPPGTILNWSAAPSTGWLQVAPPSGTGNAGLSIGVDITGLSSGTYTGQITVSDPAAFNSPQAVDVTLNVCESGNSEEPFGVFDSPVEGSTVSGNVPITGWALDDIEVTRLQIKRSSHPEDPSSAIGPDGLVFIGDAVFIKDARPDVEAAYPAFPRNDRGGWGLMVLTNFFPNQGNGTFTLYAFAYDGSGQQREIGQKQIICDNANRVKPFGTIDTPAVGATISGIDYINFGWALTPQPKFIPVDGSTMWVWLDGAPLGHPDYGHYRSDIANRFPGYANSDGAVGFFMLDTTKYTNGTHIIAWSVKDNEGAEDGIGIRRFEILNLIGSAAVKEPVKRLAQDLSGRLRIKGFDVRRLTAGEIRVSPHGRATVHKKDIVIEELERIEVHFRVKNGMEIVGWGAAEGKPLPIGSTLDSANGVFYWIPEPGYLGRHVLHFAASDGASRGKPITMVVEILPKKYLKH